MTTSTMFQFQPPLETVRVEYEVGGEVNFKVYHRVSEARVRDGVLFLRIKEKPNEPAQRTVTYGPGAWISSDAVVER